MQKRRNRNERMAQSRDESHSPGKQRAFAGILRSEE